MTESWPASVRRREADIVVRLYGPGEENLVGRKIGRLGVAFYASKDYAEKHGLPSKREEWAEHNILGFRGLSAQAEFSRWSGHVTRDTPTHFRFSSSIDMLYGVLAGTGIAALTCMTGDAYPQLVRISAGQNLLHHGYVAAGASRSQGHTAGAHGDGFHHGEGESRPCKTDRALSTLYVPEQSNSKQADRRGP